MNRILNEGFDYQDLLNMVYPTITVDEYSAKMGSDDAIITVAFMVKGEQVGNDLVDWFERGYDFVLDAQVSDGELDRNKYLVFVELDRRRKAPERIIELLEDLKTLTDFDLDDWRVIIDDKELKADAQSIAGALITSPHEYREIKQPEEGPDIDGDGDMDADIEQDIDADLNEMRTAAGLETKRLFETQDSEIKAFKAIAGL